MTNNKKFSQAGIGALAVIMLAAPFLSIAATLNRQLDIGDKGADVSSLQTFLAQDKTLYPQGLVTGYFGGLTSSAVSNFQARNGIDNVGRVGPITLVALNAQMGGTPAGSVTDISAPMIFNVKVDAFRTSATINWNTTESAKGVVYYSTSVLSEYEYLHSVAIGGSVAMTDTALRSSQSVVIAGLQPNTTYYYDIYVTDASGNVSMTMQTTFRTTN